MWDNLRENQFRRDNMDLYIGSYSYHLKISTCSIMKNLQSVFQTAKIVMSIVCDKG